MEFIIGIICLLFGSFLTYKIINNKNRLSAKSIVTDAENKAEQIKKEKILQAKEKFFELKTEHEKEILRKNNEINKSTQRIKQKENSLNQKLSEVNKKDVALKQTKNGNCFFNGGITKMLFYPLWWSGGFGIGWARTIENRVHNFDFIFSD